MRSLPQGNLRLTTPNGGQSRSSREIHSVSNSSHVQLALRHNERSAPSENRFVHRLRKDVRYLVRGGGVDNSDHIAHGQIPLVE